MHCSVEAFIQIDYWKHMYYDIGNKHIEVIISPLQPGPDSQMTRASVSCFVRSEDSDLTGSNLGRVKPMTYKIATCHFLARCSALLGYTTRTGWLSVRIM